MEQRRARGRRRLPGARAGAVRPRRRDGRRPRAPGRPAAGLRARPLRGTAPKLLQDFTEAEQACVCRSERGGAARALPGRPGLHQPRAARRPRRRGDAVAPFRVKAHGSELEYSMRGRPELGEWGRETLAQAEVDLRRLRAHPARARRRRRRSRSRASRCRRASTSTCSCSRIGRRRSQTCSPRRATIRRTRRATSGCRTKETPSGSRSSSPVDAPTVVYFGKLIEQKGVQLLLEAMQQARRAARRRRLRPLPGCSSRRWRRSARLFTGPLEHRHLVHLLPLATRPSCPRSSPRRSAWSRPRLRPPARRPLVARHSGLAEVAAGLEESTRSGSGDLASFELGRPERSRAQAGGILALSPASTTRSGGAARQAVVERWSWRSVARRLLQPV